MTETDLQTPLRFYKEERAEGGFEAGIEAALQSILVNPEFLFRVEKSPANVAPNTAYRISDLELASRLSFFLWSSIPDDELLDVASRGKLHEPAVLERQVKRMLADSRSEALVENFAGQWLHLRNLDTQLRIRGCFRTSTTTCDRRSGARPNCFSRASSRKTAASLELLTANYTFLNERLAKHYGIPNVYGSRFRRVTLDGWQRARRLAGSGKHPDGDVLWQPHVAGASRQVDPGEHSRHAAAAAAAERAGAGGARGRGKVLSMRERMAQHRTNPVCASCHI